MRDSIRESILSTVEDLLHQGVIDEITMREMEAICLPEIKPYSPSAIKKLRAKLKLSQTTLAKFLNTSASTVQKWETGAKKPSGIAMKLLSLADDKGIAGLV